MQQAEAVLSILGEKSTKDRNHVFERLYRNLFNPDFFLLAYNNISAKEGNMTKGVDGQTIDGFNHEHIDQLIEALKREAYHPSPVRRIYIPKKDGSKRPLGIPSVRDKLVQEVVRLLLQAIYEPRFSENSHGFRPGRSCHTALTQIKTTCKGANWVIEGDIKGFFDAISHEKLLDLLSHTIRDGRFIELIRRFLKAGYMEFKHVQHSITGTPQGGIISPILANVYLHEFDLFMEGLCESYTTHPKHRNQNRVYNRLNVLRHKARKKGDEQQAKELLKQMRSMPSIDPYDKNRRMVKYTRYADDFVIMISGPKELATEIREKVHAYLREVLQLELNLEKTVITNLSDQNVRFLGYEIAKTHEDTQITKDTRGRKRRLANGTIQLLVPDDVIQRKLTPFKKNGKAVHHNARINSPLLDTLNQYNAEIRGLYYYYSLATDVAKKLGTFKFYHYYSLLKTVARKEKCSVKAVLDKYGVEVKRKVGTGTRNIFGLSYQTKEGMKTMIYFNEPLRKRDKPQTGSVGQGMILTPIPLRHQILDRLNANRCELCGYASPEAKSFEVHHVRKLKDIKRRYARRGKHIPTWVLAMSRLNRKTLVVCKKCHLDIHNGYMDKQVRGR